MFKKIGMGVATGLMALGAVIVTGGTAGAVPQPAVGSVTCAVHGKGTFGPPLTAAGVATTAVKTTFKGKSYPASCSGTVGIPSSTGTLTPVTVHGAKFKGTGYYTGTSFANSCPVWSSTDSVGAMNIKIVWSATPAIANTTVKLTGPGLPVVSGAGTDTITLPSGATVAVSGSFATPPPTFLLTMVTNIVAACSTTWGPYPTYVFGGTGSVLSI